MIYLTVFMLIIYLVSFVRGGLFTSFRENLIRLTEEDINGRIKFKGEASESDVIKLVIQSIWVTVVGLAIALLQFVFIVSALSVDVFFVPTAIILTLYIGNIILTLAGKNKEKTREMKPRSGWQIFKSVLLLIYIIYILFLILI